MQERIVTKAVAQWLNVTRDAFGMALEGTTKAQEQTLTLTEGMRIRRGSFEGAKGEPWRSGTLEFSRTC